MMAVSAEKKVPFTFIWTIENVSELTELHFKSPRFIAHSISKVEWCLKIHQYIDFCCVLASDDVRKEQPTSLCAEFSLLSPDGSPLISKKTDKHTFFIFLMPTPTFLEKWNEFVQNNTLTVRCRMWRKGQEISTTDICHVRTRLKICTRSFLWSIEKFSALKSTVAEDFSKLALDEKKVYPLNPLTSKGYFVAFILYLKRNAESEDLCVDFLIGKGIDYGYNVEISVLDATGLVIASSVQGCRAEVRKDILNIRNIISKNKLIANKELFIPNDTLLLKCTFEVSDGVISNDIEYHTTNVSFVLKEKNDVLNSQAGEITENNVSQFEEYFIEEIDVNYPDSSVAGKSMHESCNKSCSLKAVLKCLYTEATLSDANLRFGDKLYPVHKNILCARSPVFNSIFSNDKEKNTFEINDMDEDTLNRLLQYIYTEMVDDLLFENALDLYKVAAKYKLMDLKDKCSDILISNFSEVNIHDIQSLANEYQDKKLEIAAGVFDSDLDSIPEVNENSKKLSEYNFL